MHARLEAMRNVSPIKFPLEMKGLKNLYLELIICDSKSSRSEYDDLLQAQVRLDEELHRSIDIIIFKKEVL